LKLDKIIYKDVKTCLPDLLQSSVIVFDEPMHQHTSFKIGGKADVFCRPDDYFTLALIIEFACHFNYPFMILGRGSNLLVGDNGIRGVVISTERLNKMKRFGNQIYAECGVVLKDLCEFACSEGLSGLEFASGIPGSVGGAVTMNAGAYDGEIRDVLSLSTAISPSQKARVMRMLFDYPFPLEIVKFDNEQHQFSYRKSIFQKQMNPMTTSFETDLAPKNLISIPGFIHLYSIFSLVPQSIEEIRAKMDDLDQKRKSKQPTDLPSAGSVFKRPTGHFTGKLIDDCGLRGFRIGDAAISDKHCGFIVNLGSATAKDVLCLIEHVKKTVFDRFAVELEEEIRIIGE